MKRIFAFLILSTSLIAGDNKPTTLVFPTRLHIPIRKATKFHLFLYAQNKVRVNDPQGIAVTRLYSWEDTTTTSDDDEITIYGVNSGQGVIIYNATMYSLGFYGLREKGAEKLKKPHGITAAPWGDVYVADTGNNRVVHLFNPKKKLEFVRALDHDEMKKPMDVELTADSILFVSDFGNNRILRYRNDALDSVIIGSGKNTGSVWKPTGLAAISRKERWSFWHEEFLIVIDHEGKRLQKFSFDGALRSAVSLDSLGLKKVDLQYAEIDYFGQIWVTDKNNHCVYKFDRNLQFLDKFGKKGKGDFEFIQPRGISFHRQLGQILIAEKEAAQYYWIGTDALQPAAKINADGYLALSFFLTEPSFLNVKIRNKQTGEVWQPLKKKRLQTGQRILYFAANGRYLVGRRIDGKMRYLRKAPQFTTPVNLELTLKLSATYSSYRYFEKEIKLRVQ